MNAQNAPTIIFDCPMHHSSNYRVQPGTIAAAGQYAYRFRLVIILRQRDQSSR
jgi:hypothetical protein